MTAYLLRRLGGAVFTVFAVTTLTFFLIHLAPGDPFTPTEGSRPRDPAIQAQQVRRYHLDKPLPVQYAIYLGRVAQGDFGISFASNEPAWTAIRERVPNTLLLAGAALLIDFAIGIAIGAWQGMRPGSWSDRALSVVSLTLYSVPVFWVGALALAFFGLKLHWFPQGGTFDISMHPFFTPFGRFVDRVHHLALPALTLGLIGAAGTARYQRAAMIEVMRQPFVRTARANGLPPRAVFRHGLRNALVPSVTLLGVAFPILLSGVVLVESVFSWPGIGRLSAEAIMTRDYPIVMAAAIVAAAMVSIGNILADLLYRVVDPRLRREAA